MRSTLSRARRRIGGLVPVLAFVAGAGLLPCHGAADDPRARAIEMYDQGRYAEARPLLEAIDKDGKADGPVLYRLSFCLAATDDKEGERRLLERASTLLERETVSGGGIESWFYLANAYRNLGRTADARKAAAEATGKVEAKSWPEPADPLDMFRLGKLYADQDREPAAGSWYRKAIEGFASAGGRYPAYVQYARRYLADSAFSRADFGAAEKEYAALVAAGGARREDYWRLAVARVRSGSWSLAADAFKECERIDPATGDDPRYGRQLALQAGSLEALPTADPKGRGWNQLSKDDLETVMTEQVQVARDTLSKAVAPESVEPRASLETTIASARALFVAAALEYTVRGLPIRDTAFVGGYAPLIFRPEQWEVPKAQ